MNKNEILQKINSNINLLQKALGTIYHGKTFAVISGGKIDIFFKTKRGAEGSIKRNQNLSYYDDYSQELSFPNKNDFYIEILASELVDIKTDKQLWYNYLKSNMYAIMEYHQGQNIIYTAKEFGVSEEIITYIEETIQEIETTRSITVINFEENKTEEPQTNLFKITSKQWNKTSKDYKSIINDVKYIYKNNELEPVEIDDMNGNELRAYLFEECYITYNVLAWNIEDAQRIAKECGHTTIENLRLKKN